MNLNALLRFGIVTLLLIFVAVPLVAWNSSKTMARVSAMSAFESKIATAETPSTDIPADLNPTLLAATYSGHSGCAATNHEFEVVLDVLDAGNSLYRVRNLLDEGEVIKARLKDGQLQLGRQKMGSYQVTGYVKYMENPSRIETHVKYDDGIGYCEDVSVFNKR